MTTISSSHLGVSLRTNRPLQALIAWYALFWIVMAISPFDHSDWLLENLLVFISIGFLVITYRSFPLSTMSYFLITVFLTLHAVGAHYTYEHVPFGYWLKDLFGEQRNHFDRLVHFAFGLLLTYPLREALLRVVKTSTFWSYFLPLSVVIAFSSFYELIEGWVARIVSPELGAAYLGTQGDIWDAQKDMNAAMVGAVLSTVITAIAARKKEGSAG